MRGIVLRESLPGHNLPLELPAIVVRRYPHLLDRRIPVNVLELQVTSYRASDVAFRLASVLLPQGFYAHLVDERMMIVIFPRCVIQIPRGDEAAADTARRVGALYGIPDRQMRFQEMFTIDHPDSEAEPMLDGAPSGHSPAPNRTSGEAVVDDRRGDTALSAVSSSDTANLERGS
ncbi:hypothetical protein ACQP2U_42715 (plasmid) [Nocardia sp. CA-084685]|uniref:hypothetical protein n=1 Tax=Nocardia sp. CA-084685 TaxID=3239970 RepID=UPI003D95A1CA